MSFLSEQIDASAVLQVHNLRKSFLAWRSSKASVSAFDLGIRLD